MMQNMMQDMLGGGGLWRLWMLLPLLFWGGLLALVAWVLVRIFPGRRDGEKGAPAESAKEVLRKRFARGEIDAEEYERTLEVLRDRNLTKGGA